MSVGQVDLRIAVATHYWAPHVGGIETVARQQVEHLARRGADVEVHTSHLPRTVPARPRPPDGRPSDAGEGEVRIVRHAALDPFATALQVPVPLPGPGMARALAEAARRCDIVIAHGHSYPSSMLAAWAARRARRPLVLVQHSPWVAYGRALEAVEHAVDRTVGRAVIRAADRVVCVSEHTAAYVHSIEPSAMTVVVPNGVDTSRFRPADPSDASGASDVPSSPGAASTRPAIVLFVGRIVRRNGWHVLLDAWRRAGLGARAELHVVGSGPDDAALRAAARGLDGVRILGRIDDADLADHYRAAHVVVVPSTTGEGFGLVAAEALACGTPVVASAQGGLAEVVRHEQDGLLVAPGDAAALAAALQRTIDDAALHAALSRHAHAQDRSQESATDALLDVLMGTLRGSCAPAMPSTSATVDAPTSTRPAAPSGLVGAA